jgi:hypothetical protein
LLDFRTATVAVIRVGVIVPVFGVLVVNPQDDRVRVPEIAAGVMVRIDVLARERAPDHETHQRELRQAGSRFVRGTTAVRCAS